MQEKKTGIEESATDKVQPYRVWYEGYIVRFCKTREEAEQALEYHRANPATRAKMKR